MYVCMCGLCGYLSNMRAKRAEKFRAKFGPSRAVPKVVAILAKFSNEIWVGRARNSSRAQEDKRSGKGSGRGYWIGVQEYQEFFSSWFP